MGRRGGDADFVDSCLVPKCHVRVLSGRKKNFLSVAATVRNIYFYFNNLKYVKACNFEKVRLSVKITEYSRDYFLFVQCSIQCVPYA